MINPAKLLKMKSAWDTFTRNHPKFPLFLKAMQQSAIEEGTIIEITVTTPEGKTLNTNVKLTGSDMELFRDLTDLAK